MSTIKRFQPSHTAYETATGEYILASDYDALATEHDRVTSILSKWRKLVEEWSGFTHVGIDSDHARPALAGIDPLTERLAAIPSFQVLSAEVARLTARLDEIKAGAEADEEDLAKMRDGTKLTRAGLVQVIVYQQQELSSLRLALEAVEKERDEQVAILKLSSKLRQNLAEERDKLEAALAAESRRREDAEVSKQCAWETAKNSDKAYQEERARREAVDKENAQLKAEDGGLVDLFLHRLLEEMVKRDVDMSSCDGEDEPEVVLANWLSREILDPREERDSLTSRLAELEKDKERLLNIIKQQRDARKNRAAASQT